MKGAPMFPAAGARSPAASSKVWIRPAVVVFPFVPVTPMTGVRQKRKASSISLRTGTPAAAARAWALARVGKIDAETPVTVDDDLAAQFREMGASVEAAPDETTSEAIEIMASNRDSMLGFLAVETQWRVAATMGGMIWLGLDYNAVDVVMRRQALPDAIFADIATMEASALSVLNGGE